MKRGKLYTISVPFVRLGIGCWKVDVDAPAGPTVYVCSHGNLRGPLAALSWLPFAARPWVLHVFLEKETCRTQYRDFTFSQRFGMSKPVASLCAWAVSGYVSTLMHALGAIPVYRGTSRIQETFQKSVAALQAGDSVLIFPDVDYTNKSGAVGEIYEGFLLLERFWRKVSDQQLRFVPLHLDIARKRITAGEALIFERSAAWKPEMHRVKEALRAEMNRE